MRAIVQTGYGAPASVLRLADLPRPEPGEGEVLVRVRGTGVNTPDWIAVTGTPYVLRLQSGLRGPRTPVRGTDVAGVVEETGSDVTDLRPGDEVFGSLWGGGRFMLPHGAFAELVPVPAAELALKPSSVSFEEAGAAGMSGLTALIAMRDTAQAGPGRHVLVNGASGGVGTFAVQIAKALGAEVTGVCSARNVELVRSLGADHVVDYTQRDFTQDAGRYDVILDNVLSHPPKLTARALAVDGILIPNSVGNGGGLLAGLPRMAQAKLLGRRRDVRFTRCVVNRDNLTALADLLESGAVRVVIDRTYPLEEADGAVARMLSHRASGNVAIRP
jgi:NADPH:quinone reductase-like Zn-dependent oxidoreductase